jgi:Amino acid permease
MWIFLTRFRNFLLGSPLNPFSPEIFKSIALVAFFAWIGLGADGLSSSCYGPEEAYLALGSHTHLAIYIALATAITVFVISLGYNQVIELFPSGGGGYKVATQLLHPYAGLVSGAALLVDYMLTITISVASGTDAVFSLLPSSYHSLSLTAEVILVIVLLFINLRGMKESIQVLLPIFMGFVITHFLIIVYGIAAHSRGLIPVVSEAIQETGQLHRAWGWLPLLALLLHSYSLGAGTYTGLEAVSNNVHRLSDPKVRTGKWTMFYMAVSLSFTASGLLLLYLLWQVSPKEGQTLNAVVFHSILGDSAWGSLGQLLLLLFEGGLLFVAANTGFLAGPATLANMALDDWVPSRFRHLSSRLVMQNGLFLFGGAAIALLVWTRGQIHLLVVLYSINVFITFSLSLLGLCVYWLGHRNMRERWFGRFLFSLFGLLIASAILVVMLFSKFLQGGWVTLSLTSTVIILCLMIKKHYTLINKKLGVIDRQITPTLIKRKFTHYPLDPQQPTAVFFIAKSRGVAMHTLLSARRLFPNYFRNFIFLSVGAVDIESFHGQDSLEKMKSEVEAILNYFVSYCQQFGLAATSFAIYGTDVIEPLVEESERLGNLYPDITFFAGKLVREHENWITRLLDNETSMILQRRLFALGKQLIIMPMKI